MKSQREAVEQAVLEVKGQYTSQLSKSELESIYDIVETGLKQGDVKLSDRAKEKYENDLDALSQYTRNLVSNWLRKSELLNGGSKYQPKTKRGSRNVESAHVDSLQALLDSKGDSLTDEERSAIQDEINSHRKTKKNEATKNVPEDLLEVF